MAVDDIRLPTELHNCFEHSFIVEGKALGVVWVKFLCFRINEHPFSLEIGVVIQKVNLKLGIWNTCHFNFHALVIVAYFNLDTRQSNYFVQSVTSIVDGAVFWQQNSNFKAFVLQRRREEPQQIGGISHSCKWGDFSRRV